MYELPTSEEGIRALFARCGIREGWMVAQGVTSPVEAWAAFGEGP